ncbi:hypothetical protein CPAR01_01442 [Colletotrichum paranaense]|uniref:Uncharacterized protein n=2 Tax=Colletotrichum acutatum species complex TaxID=2707335 RepID=A0ABQ9T757_9PEZI|nr:uncharacterized protein CPAR01_01442 [Colletotrichum paranaense]XP_060387775.1 uncharacterized protein CTAM01_01272 [Colletotrichum tamarilloi]KAK1510699.1 hypothetical protein CTAM01_01272 [Colletotrichum tamarilloi]KAK1547475.1 hypothetical protein CPAR01_01442 [Colletotrichum paranaense]
MPRHMKLLVTSASVKRTLLLSLNTGQGRSVDRRYLGKLLAPGTLGKMGLSAAGNHLYFVEKRACRVRCIALIRAPARVPKPERLSRSKEYLC